MNLKLLSLLGVMAMISVAKGDLTTGAFKYHKADCTWKEWGVINHQQRTLSISCKAFKNKKHTNENRPRFKCQYKGNPHHYKNHWYHGHEFAFYKCLVDKLVRNNTLCKAPNVSCENHLPEVTFNLTHSNRLNIEHLERSKNIGYESDEDDISKAEEILYDDDDDDDEADDDEDDDDDKDDDRMFRPYV